MPQEIIDVPIRDPERLRRLLAPDRLGEFERGAEEARALFAERTVWNVNSTARGGGVAELLRPLVGYARGLGIDARWLVIDGDPAFFEVTKRIHNRLHGFEGDSGLLDAHARGIYERTLAQNTVAFRPRLRPGDVVVLHDPQTAGMAPALRSSAGSLIWRCHIGVDEPNDLARDGWAFLQPYAGCADVCVFSRDAFVWDGLSRDRVAIITPTIDPFTPKNDDLAPETVLAVLRASGLLRGSGPAEPVTFLRQDGSPGRIERQAGLIEDEPLRAETPVVVQVSRWDALKDPVGVICGFAEHVPAETGAHLVYVGPSVDAVADDPEGAQLLRDSIAARSSLPHNARRRIHLATLPMDDPDENAIIVNALQRHARVVAQKSIAEGFGLTVAEAMWKGRPVVASRVGGIEEQIIDGESGILLNDPRDLIGFGQAITELLANRQRAEQIGQAARERIRDHFLSTRSLLEYLAVIRRILRDRSSHQPQA
jgi:trehalose synthase